MERYCNMCRRSAGTIPSSAEFDEEYQIRILATGETVSGNLNKLRGWARRHYLVAEPDALVWGWKATMKQSKRICLYNEKNHGDFIDAVVEKV